MTPTFDLRGLFVAIDSERTRQGLAWTTLADRVGVAASTIRRYSDADDAEADGVLALLRWLGDVPEDHIADSTVTGRRLTAGGYIRVDMDKVAAANGDPNGAKGRTRTTIQRLVESAQQSGQTVTSLTRRGDV